MHHWQLIDDRTLALLAHLSHHFPTYETHRLDLTTCTHLSEEALIETASLWHHLTAMATPSRSAVAQTLGEVAFCSQCHVTLQGLRHLGAFAKLRKLELSFGETHKEQAIGVLGDVCPQLEQLSMPMPRWTADMFAQLPNLTSLHKSPLSLETLEQLHAAGRLKHLTSLGGCAVSVDCEEAGKALVDLLSEPDSKLVEGPALGRFAVRELIKRTTSQQQSELLAPPRPAAARNPLASWTGLNLWDQAWRSASLVPVLRAFPALRKLELEANGHVDNRLPSSQLTFASVAAGFEALPHLNELVLVGFRCNDAASVAALLSSDCTDAAAGGTWQSSLTKLALHGADLSGAFIAAMAHGLSGLTSLDLDQVTNPSGVASAEHETDESLMRVLSERDGEGGQPKLAQLRSLALSGFFRHHQPRRRGSCSGADETGCRFHLEHPLLQHLVVYGCGSASDDDEDEDENQDNDDNDDNDSDNAERGRPLRIGLTIECAELRSCRIDPRDMHGRDLVRTITSLCESSPLLTSVHVSLDHDLDFYNDHDENDSGTEPGVTADQQSSWIPHALHRLVSACPLLTTVILTGQPPLGVAPPALQRLAQAQEAAQLETRLAVAPMDDGDNCGGANLQRLELLGRFLLSGGRPLSMSAAEPETPPVHSLLMRFPRLTRLTLDANCTPANSRDHRMPFAEAELRALALLPSLEKLSIRGVLSGEGDCEDGDQGATLAIEGGAGAGGGHRWPRLRSVKVRHARLAVATVRHVSRLERVRLVTHAPKALVMWLAVAHCPCLAQVRVRAAALTPALAVRLVSHVNDVEAKPVGSAEGAFSGCRALRSLRLEPADRVRISSADLATVVAACPLVRTVPARSGGCVAQ